MTARQLTDKALARAVWWLLKITRQRGVMIFSISPEGQWSSMTGGKDNGGLQTVDNLHNQLIQGMADGSIRPPSQA